ncbi:glycosyltransferase family 87 protein [Dongia sp.]|uniref:glycosyltransferase family 87 protein n=1 Tax=Dongia sp. TaxID=1977262 RepID=UPI0035B1D62E
MNQTRDGGLPFSRGIFLRVGPILALLFLAIDNYHFLTETLSRGQIIGRDFTVFWTSSVLLWRGEIAAIFDPVLNQMWMERIIGLDLAAIPFPYPPHSLYFVAPWGFMPYFVALPLWLLTTLLGLLAVLRLNLDDFATRFSLPRWTIIAAFVLSPACLVNVAMGQNGFLSSALLCGGLLLLERKPLLAGVLIGLLSYKPQLGLLLPFLLIAGGYWRPFWVATATVIALLTASVIFLGIDAWKLYLAEAAPQQMAFAQFGHGVFQQMTPSYFMAGRLLGIDLALAWGVQICVSIAVLCATIWAFRQNVTFKLKCALAMVAAFIVSPYVLIYDMPIIAIAILIAGSCFKASQIERTIFALAWLFPAYAIFIPLPIGPVVLTGTLLVLLRRIWIESRLPQASLS